MALNIPNVGSGMDIFAKGFHHTSDNLLKKMLQKEFLKQKADQFAQEMAFKQQQESRLGANSGINRQILEEQLLGLKHKNDPMFEYKALQDMLTGGGQPPASNDTSTGVESTGENVNGGDSPNTYVPPNNGDDMALGQPISAGQKAIEAQQQESAPADNGSQPDALMNNPLVRGFLKHKLGYDPFAPAAQTPAQKEATALDLFNKKEAIKKQNKSGTGEVLTDKTKSKYQAVVGGATTALPIIDNIIEMTKKGNVPGQAIGALFKRDKQATYKGEVSTLLDGIRNAYTIPNTDSGTEKAEDKVLRKSGESDSNYITRLQTIRKQIVNRQEDAKAKLHGGNITATATAPEDYTKMTEEELHKIAGGG
jgi:hypothetical protein